jgi:hypothetical protein
MSEQEFRKYVKTMTYDSIKNWVESIEKHLHIYPESSRFFAEGTCRILKEELASRE